MLSTSEAVALVDKLARHGLSAVHHLKASSMSKIDDGAPLSTLGWRLSDETLLASNDILRADWLLVLSQS